MRSLWILVAVMSLSIGVQANHGKAAIVIKSERGIPLIVQLDGRGQQQARPVVHLNNIRPGHHSIRIYRMRGGHGHYGHHGHPQRELIYRGQIRLRPGLKSVFVVHHGHLDLVSQRPINSHGGGHGYGYGGGHGNCGHGGSGSGYGACSVHGVYDCGCDPSGYGSGYDSGYGNWQDYGCSPDHCNGHCGGSCGYGSPGSYNGYYSPVPDHFFRSMMNRSRRYFIDDDKVEFFQKELGDKYVTNKQVESMADELFFEPSKYKLLTGLFDNSSKPKDYRELSEVFTFNNTRKDFEKFVQSEVKTGK